MRQHIKIMILFFSLSCLSINVFSKFILFSLIFRHTHHIIDNIKFVDNIFSILCVFLIVPIVFVKTSKLFPFFSSVQEYNVLSETSKLFLKGRGWNRVHRSACDAAVAVPGSNLVYYSIYYTREQKSAMIFNK